MNLLFAKAKISRLGNVGFLSPGFQKQNCFVHQVLEGSKLVRTRIKTESELVLDKLHPDNNDLRG